MTPEKAIPIKSVANQTNKHWKKIFDLIYWDLDMI